MWHMRLCVHVFHVWEGCMGMMGIWQMIANVQCLGVKSYKSIYSFSLVLRYRTDLNNIGKKMDIE